MNTGKINDTLQILASLGVIIGLLVVAYELQQNQVIAEAEHDRGSLGSWMQLTAIEMETDIGEVIIKSIEDPDNLTKAEMFRINAWLQHNVVIYAQSDRARELGVGAAEFYMSEAEARYYFSSEYSRQWFRANRYWIRPNIREAISRVIENTPIATEWHPLPREGVVEPPKSE